MTNPYYNHLSGVPASVSKGTSSALRAEFDAIAAGFEAVATASSTSIIPPVAGNNNKLLATNGLTTFWTSVISALGIQSSTIESSPIGSVTPSTGTFTSLTALSITQTGSLGAALNMGGFKATNQAVGTTNNDSATYGQVLSAKTEVKNDISADLANTADPAKGAGLEGYNPSLSYPANTTGKELNKIDALFPELNQTAPVVTCYGDSFTMGSSGGIAYSEAYINLIAAAKGWSIPVPPDFGTAGKGSTSVGNQAFGGSQIASTEQIDRIMSHTTTDTDIQFILTGFNDARAMGVTANGIATYRQTLQAALAWMAIPASSADKLNANNGTARVVRAGAGWAANTSWFGGNGYHTNTISATFTATVFGDTIYLALPKDSTTTGKCLITVDGTNYGTYDYAGNVTTVQYSKAYSIGFVRISGLTRTTHTVVLTKTSATSGTDYMRVDWVAGVDGIKTAQAANGGPRVFVGNCCRMTAAGYASAGPSYNNASDGVMHGYNTIIEQVTRELAADGLNITYVDASSFFDPNSSDLAGDGVHPSAIGMQKIANAFLEKMDERKVHVKDRGVIASGQEFFGRQYTTIGLGSVTELGDKSNSTALRGAGLETSMSYNLRLTDGVYYRVREDVPTWVIVADSTTAGPKMLYKAAGVGAITSWDRTIYIDTSIQNAWVAPTLLNSWVNFGGAWGDAAYMIDTMGFVHLKGLVKSGTVGAPLFVLPAGYRPLTKIGFPIMANGAFGWVSVLADGTVQIEAGSNVFASIDGITFRTA
jgi:hypothetical protein